MRYLTKEWYNDMQLWGCSDAFRKIPDRTYTEEDIRDFYQKALKRSVQEDQKLYNTCPKLFIPDSLFEEPFHSEEWPVIDEETNEVSFLNSAEEVREHMEYEHAKAVSAFENRLPFDPKESIEVFETIYRAGIHNAREFYPHWLSEEVDERLIALGLLPESAYRKYKEQIRNIKKEWKKSCLKNEKASAKQDISSEIRELFHLHDSELVSLRKRGMNLVMDYRIDGAWEEEKEYSRIILSKAQILERDQSVNSRGNTTFIYHEIYHEKDIYEVHILFWASSGLGYLTVQCEDIKGYDF